MKAAQILTFALLISVALSAQTPQAAAAQEQSFPASVESVKAALKDLGAYTGGRLPSLSGFIVEGAPLEELQHPYYEFKIETIAQGDKTLVRVKANVSAWYSDGDSGKGMYRNLPSNGRLEADLLDRLKSYLTDHMVTATTDTAVLKQHIASLRQQRQEAEAKLAELKRQSASLDAALSAASTSRLASPNGTNTPVLADRSGTSAVRLRAGREDVFEVIGERDEWYRVRLGTDEAGWVKRSQVHTLETKMPVAAAEIPDGTNAFIVTREQMFPFAGEWAPLKNKDALFLFVQPDAGSNAKANPELKLRFAESLFAQRFAGMTHDSSSKRFDGIVVIFLDRDGGVAAATVRNIQLWREGQLSHTGFLSKCSLDPIHAFLSNAPKPVRANRRDGIQGSATSGLTRNNRRTQLPTEIAF